MNYKFWRKILKPFVSILWPVEVINSYKFEEKKAICVCNHYSIMDGNNFATKIFKNKMNVVVKKEAYDIKIARPFLDCVGAIPISRGDADMKAIKDILSVLKKGEPLLIFPEGTRNKDDIGKMLPIKDGPVVFALKTKAPIIPFMYSKPVKLFRKTFLIVGDQIELNEFYGKPLNDVRELASEILYNKMGELRDELMIILADKSRLQAIRKDNKLRLKEAKLNNKKAVILSKENINAVDAVIEIDDKNKGV